MTIKKILATRDGFGQGIPEAAHKNNKVVVLSADLSSSLRLDLFKKNLPSRYIECGVAEQNLAGVAAGLSLGGKIPFATSFAAFNPGRNFDQIRLIAYSNLNVKIVGGHAGLTTAEDGATHQILEDLSLMLSLPNFKIFSPADARQAQEITLALADDFGPSYLRLSRMPVSNLKFLLAALPNKVKLKSFKIGEVQQLTQGKQVTMLVHGALTQEALKASLSLYQKGIEVELFNLPSLKPLKIEPILESCQKTKALMIVSEEQKGHGFNAYINQLISQEIGKKLKQAPVVEIVAVDDSFGESGSAEDLLKKYQLDQKAILKKALALLEKKQSMLAI